MVLKLVEKTIYTLHKPFNDVSIDEEHGERITYERLENNTCARCKNAKVDKYTNYFLDYDLVECLSGCKWVSPMQKGMVCFKRAKDR